MAEIFSEAWMTKYKSIWNSDNEHIQYLADSDFTSKVGFGLVDDESPRVMLEIHHGLITNVAVYKDEILDWDLRGKVEFWQAVSQKAPNLMRLGLAYTSRDLKFVKGDYAAMIKEPNLSSGFINCFKFMSAVYN